MERGILRARRLLVDGRQRDANGGRSRSGQMQHHTSLRLERVGPPGNKERT